jgi:hypothetical protein
VAGEKTVRAGGYIFYFLPNHIYIVGARKKYAQTHNTVVWYNIFNAITLFINITIAKAQAQ